MNKKASLKDAFVKNPEAGNQQPRDTAIQPAGFPASQNPGLTATQIAGDQPSIPPPGSLYVQPAGYPPLPPLPPKKKATFNLDAALHQRLKIAAAMHSREMVDIVQDALQAYLPALDRKVG